MGHHEWTPLTRKEDSKHVLPVTGPFNAVTIDLLRKVHAGWSTRDQKQNERKDARNGKKAALARVGSRGPEMTWPSVPAELVFLLMGGGYPPLLKSSFIPNSVYIRQLRATSIDRLERLRIPSGHSISNILNTLPTAHFSHRRYVSAPRKMIRLKDFNRKRSGKLRR